MTFSQGGNFASSGSLRQGETWSTGDHECGRTPKTFSELAYRHGVRPWNPGVLDDRWHLGPEEQWLVDQSYCPLLTVSPSDTARRTLLNPTSE